MTKPRRAMMETECDICGWYTRCRDDGEAYICIDTEACAIYQRINAITRDRNALTEQRDALLDACKIAEAWFRGSVLSAREQCIVQTLRAAIEKVEPDVPPR